MNPISEKFDELVKTQQIIMPPEIRKLFGKFISQELSQALSDERKRIEGLIRDYDYPWIGNSYEKDTENRKKIIDDLISEIRKDG